MLFSEMREKLLNVMNIAVFNNMATGEVLLAEMKFSM
jgi:hypothetical protein